MTEIISNASNGSSSQNPTLPTEVASSSTIKPTLRRNPFALQEYLQSLLRNHKDDLDLLVKLPAGQSEEAWQYEHLRQLCLELNYLVVQLEPECNKQTCPEMKADEWMYRCAAHLAPMNCCAIDYIVHTLDGATNLLNSHKSFPSRLSIPDTSVKHYQSIARRLYRIFAHAWFHHREIFKEFELEKEKDNLFITSYTSILPP
nr:13451_t:CDS:2 [Entrophospora candida]CAG8643694.1 5242_t:CDS:2 [Entrophospora candida]